MTTNEYWLSAFYSHQGQEKPDQPDNSWDPDSFGWGYGGFDLGGWGGLIPDGWYVPMYTPAPGLQMISVPLHLPDLWKSAHSPGSGATGYYLKEDGEWVFHESYGTSFTVRQNNGGMTYGSTTLTALTYYPPLGEIPGATSWIQGISDPSFVWGYSEPSGGFGDYYALYTAYQYSTNDPVWRIPDSRLKLAPGYKYYATIKQKPSIEAPGNGRTANITSSYRGPDSDPRDTTRHVYKTIEVTSSGWQYELGFSATSSSPEVEFQLLVYRSPL